MTEKYYGTGTGFGACNKTSEDVQGLIMQELYEFFRGCEETYCTPFHHFKESNREVTALINFLDMAFDSFEELHEKENTEGTEEWQRKQNRIINRAKSAGKK